MQENHGYFFSGCIPYPVVYGGAFNSGEYETYTTITIDFILPISAIGMDVTRTKGQAIGMSLYDSNDIVLEDHIWQETRPFFIGLNHVTSEISYVKIFSNNDDLDIGDLIYQTAAPVPEPATILFLGTGLVGLAGIGRKKLLNK